MELRSLIPKDKFDVSGLEQLKKLSFEQIEPIISDLLEWLQDINWPVSKSIAELLRPFTDKITFQLVDILRSNDVIWKYGILITLLRNTSDPIILKEIERIARYPTLDEIENDVNAEAISILNGEYN